MSTSEHKAILSSGAGFRRALAMVAFAIALIGLSASNYSIPQTAQHLAAGAGVVDTQQDNAAVRPQPTVQFKALLKKQANALAYSGPLAAIPANETIHHAPTGASASLKFSTDHRPARRGIAAQPRAPPVSRA